MDHDKIEKGFRMVMEGLGLDLDSPHLKDSPRRTAETWHQELFRGLQAPVPVIQPYPIEEGFQQGLIALQQIPVKSVCAHHFLPFTGTATVAFLPERVYCGLSNLSKVVDFFARRPQLQENLTHEIARFLEKALVPKGVGVMIRARHGCMEMRGVNHEGMMTTNTLLGAFKDDPATRAEFMALAMAENQPR